VIKNSFANYAFEHFEIAAYRSLLALCDATGHTAAKSALQQSLNEEIAMARWIDEHLEDTTLRYLQRVSAGLRADV
jgi:ferritin-like metal-binding protein YciE